MLSDKRIPHSKYDTIIITRVRKREMENFLFLVNEANRISSFPSAYIIHKTILLLILFSDILLTFRKTDTIDEHDIIMYYTARSNVVINKFHYVCRVPLELYDKNKKNYDNF